MQHSLLLQIYILPLAFPTITLISRINRIIPINRINLINLINLITRLGAAPLIRLIRIIRLIRLIRLIPSLLISCCEPPSPGGCLRGASAPGAPLRRNRLRHSDETLFNTLPANIFARMVWRLRQKCLTLHSLSGRTLPKGGGGRARR